MITMCCIFAGDCSRAAIGQDAHLEVRPANLGHYFRCIGSSGNTIEKLILCKQLEQSLTTTS